MHVFFALRCIKQLRVRGSCNAPQRFEERDRNACGQAEERNLNYFLLSYLSWLILSGVGRDGIHKLSYNSLTSVSQLPQNYLSN